MIDNVDTEAIQDNDNNYISNNNPNNNNVNLMASNESDFVVHHRWSNSPQVSQSIDPKSPKNNTETNNNNKNNMIEDIDKEEEEGDITQRELEKFIKERNIQTNVSNEQLFESFKVFQKFMNCMISTTNSQNTPENKLAEQKINYNFPRNQIQSHFSPKNNVLKKKPIKINNNNGSIGSIQELNEEEKQNKSNAELEESPKKTNNNYPINNKQEEDEKFEDKEIDNNINHKEQHNDNINNDYNEENENKPQSSYNNHNNQFIQRFQYENEEEHDGNSNNENYQNIHNNCYTEENEYRRQHTNYNNNPNNNNNINYNNNNENYRNDNMSDMQSPVANKNLNKFLNYDDIPVKPSQVNFVELVEKNLAELNYVPDENAPKKKIHHRSKTNSKKQQIKKNTGEENKTERANNNIIRSKYKESIPKRKFSSQRGQGNLHLQKEKKNNSLDSKNNNKKPRIHIERKYKTGIINIKHVNIKNSPDNPLSKLSSSGNNSPLKNIRKIPIGLEEDPANNNDPNLVNFKSSEIIFESKENLNSDEDDDEEDNSSEIIYNDDSEVIENAHNGEGAEKEKNEEKKNSNINTNVNMNKNSNKYKVMTPPVNSKDKNEKIFNEIDQIKKNANLIQNDIENKENFIKKNSSREVRIKTQFEQEYQQLMKEKKEVSKLRNEYIQMKNQLHRDVLEFESYKQKEISNFEKWKNEEIKKIKNEKNSHTQIENSKFNANLDKNLLQAQQEIKNNQESIEYLKLKLQKTQEEIKIRENINKQTIDKLKRQLADANNQISQLIKQQCHSTGQQNNNLNFKTMSQQQTIVPKWNIPRNKTNNYSSTNSIPSSSNSLPKKKKNNNKPSTRKNEEYFTSRIKEEKIEEEDEEYGVVFPERYKLDNVEVVNENKHTDGKTVKYYKNGAKAIYFPSGAVKEIFDDGYQLIKFNNKDIKQIFPNGKIVYFYYESSTIQNTFPDGTIIYKLKDGKVIKQKENKKSFDNSEQQKERDNHLLKSNSNDQNPNLKSSSSIVERKDGTKEIRNGEGHEIFEFSN